MSDREVVALLFAGWVVICLVAIAYALRPRGRRATDRPPAPCSPTATTVLAGTAADSGPIPVADIVAGHLGRPADPDPQAGPPAVEEQLFVPADWSAGVPPLTVSGPPETRGRIPAPHLPILRRASCTRCQDLGFGGGCTFCGRFPDPHHSP